MERKGKNYKNLKYLKNEKSFLDEIKNNFKLILTAKVRGLLGF